VGGTTKDTKRRESKILTQSKGAKVRQRRQNGRKKAQKAQKIESTKTKTVVVRSNNSRYESLLLSCTFRYRSIFLRLFAAIPILSSLGVFA
jgi:hypothetical protein